MAFEPHESYFKSKVLPFLANEYDVELRDNGSYSLYHSTHGIIDIYPKRKRLLIRKLNTWKSDAFNWINENLLTEKFK